MIKKKDKVSTKENSSEVLEAVFEQVESIEHLESKVNLPNNSIVRVVNPSVKLFRLLNNKFSEI